MAINPDEIYRMAPMPAIKRSMDAIMVLCMSTKYRGVSVPVPVKLRAKSLNTYTASISSMTDGIGYIEPVLFPNESVESVSLVLDGVIDKTIRNPPNSKIHLFDELFVPISSDYRTREIEISFRNLHYAPNSRILWIEGLYLQHLEHEQFINGVQLFSDERNKEERNKEDTSTKKYNCPECGEPTMFLDRGLCMNGHKFLVEM